MGHMGDPREGMSKVTSDKSADSWVAIVMTYHVCLQRLKPMFVRRTGGSGQRKEWHLQFQNYGLNSEILRQGEHGRLEPEEGI